MLFSINNLTAMSLQNAMLSSLNGSFPAGLPEFPANILEMVFPKHFSILNLFLQKLNLDISFIITLCLFTLTLWTWIVWASGHAYRQISIWFMSSISISSDDELFGHVLAWLADRKILGIFTRDIYSRTTVFEINYWNTTLAY
jgi:hypothetical protein